jgi:hypothetical protein
LECIPLLFDIPEVHEDDLPYFPAVFRGHIETERFLYIEIPAIQPVFTFDIPLPAMDMDWLVAFIGVEEKRPAQNKEDSRHIIYFHREFRTFHSEIWRIPGIPIFDVL